MNYNTQLSRKPQKKIIVEIIRDLEIQKYMTGEGNAKKHRKEI
ncbi:hypothetical protein [Sedimentibacter hydroxybenzoicus]|nr:hypothetical protein [Sedimentibacter hydroxybenzoicus]